MSCGFTWNFKSTKTNSKKRWIPNMHVKDSYNRKWRFKEFTQHEILGTREIGESKYFMVGCPKSERQIQIPIGTTEVYCPYCDRTGDIGPLRIRWGKRKTR